MNKSEYKAMGDNPNHGRLTKRATYPRSDGIGAEEIAGKGRGVVALRNISAGTLLERAPMLVVPDRDRVRTDKTIAFTYLFVWEKEEAQQDLYKSEGRAAIVLGMGSLLNHSDTPNVEYQPNFDELEIEFVASCDIVEGEELTIDYELELWFDPV